MHIKIIGKCFVQDCKNTAGKTPGVSFYAFPANTLNKEKWLKRINRTDGFLPSFQDKVCSQHFKESCIDHSSLRHKLLPGSLPSIFPNQNQPSRSARLNNLEAAGASQSQHVPSDKLDTDHATMASEKMGSANTSPLQSQHGHGNVVETSLNDSGSVKRPSSSLNQQSRKSVTKTRDSIKKRPRSSLRDYAGIKVTDHLDKNVNLNPVVRLEKIDDIYDLSSLMNFNTTCENQRKKRRIKCPKQKINQYKYSETSQSSCYEFGIESSDDEFILSKSQNEDDIIIPKISGVCSLAPTEKTYEVNFTKAEVEFFQKHSKYELVSQFDYNTTSEENYNEDIKPTISSTIDISDFEYSDEDDFNLKNYQDYYDTTEFLSDSEFEDNSAPQSPKPDLKCLPISSTVIKSPPAAKKSLIKSLNKNSSVNKYLKEVPVMPKITNLQTIGASVNFLKESAEIQEKMLKMPHEIIQALPSSLSIICKPRKKMEEKASDDKEVQQKGGLIIIPRPVTCNNIPMFGSTLEIFTAPKHTLKEDVPDKVVEQCTEELADIPQKIEGKSVVQPIKSLKSTSVKKKKTPCKRKLSVCKEKSIVPQLEDSLTVPVPSKDKKLVEKVEELNQSALNNHGLLVEFSLEPTTSLQLTSNEIPEKAWDTLKVSSVEPTNNPAENVATSEDKESSKPVDKPDESSQVPASLLQNALVGNVVNNKVSSGDLEEDSSSMVLPSSSVENPVTTNEYVKPLQGPSQSTQGGVVHNQLTALPPTMKFIQFLKPVTPSKQGSNSVPPTKKMKMENPTTELQQPIDVHHKDENVEVNHYGSTSAVKTPAKVTAPSVMPPLVYFLPKNSPQLTTPNQYPPHIKMSTKKSHHIPPSSKTVPITSKISMNSKILIPITMPPVTNSDTFSKSKSDPPPLETISSNVTLSSEMTEMISNTNKATSTAPQQQKENISLSKVPQLPLSLKTLTTSKVQALPPDANIIILPIGTLPLQVNHSLETTKVVSKVETLKTLTKGVRIDRESSKKHIIQGATSSPCLLPFSMTASQTATMPTTTEVTSQVPSPSKSPLQATVPSMSPLPTDVATPTSQQIKKLPSPISKNDEVEIIKEVSPPHPPCVFPASSRDKMSVSPSADSLANGSVGYNRRLLLSLLLGERAGARDFTLELKRQPGRLDQLRVFYPSSQIPSVNILVRGGTKLVTYSSLFYGADATDPMQDCELFRCYQELDPPKNDNFIVLTNRYVGQSLSSVFEEWSGTLSGLRLPLYCLKKDFQGQDNVLARLCGSQVSDTLRTQAQTFLSTICFAVAQTESVLDRYLQKKLDTEFLKPEQTKQVLAKLLEWTSLYIGESKSGDISISGTSFNDVLREMKKQLKVHYQLISPKSYFFGRDFELLKADQILKTQSKKIVDLVVCGLAGVGKTEFVRYYLQLREHMYSSVIVINAESTESLQLSLQKAAKHFKLDTNTEAPINRQACRIIASKLFDHFSNKKALIVFDNVDTTESIKNLLFMLSKNVTNTNITVFITSRYTSWDDVPAVKLDVFEKEEAKLFLRQNLASDENDDDLIQPLAEQLSHHPFALQIAVTCINREVEALKVIGDKLTLQKNIQGYLITNKKLQDNLNASSLKGKQSEACLASLITAWQRTKNSIKNEKYGEIALKIFEIMSYMATEEIDLEVFLLLRNVTQLSDEEDSDDEEESAQRVLCTAVSVLNKYCLLEAQGGKAHVHRLLQQVVRTNLRDIEHREKEVLDAALSIAHEDNRKNERTYDLSSTNFSKPLLFIWIDIMNHAVNYIDIIIKYSMLVPKLMMDIFNSNEFKDKINFACALFQTIIGILDCALKNSSSDIYNKILNVIHDAKLQLARFLWLERNDSESEQVYTQVHSSLVKSVGISSPEFLHAEAFRGAYKLERLCNNSKKKDSKNMMKNHIVYSLTNVIKNFESILTNHFGSLIILERIAFELSSMSDLQVFSVKIYTELLARRAELRDSVYLTPSPIENILKLLPSLGNCLWNKMTRHECVHLLRLCLEEALLCREGQIESLITYLKHVSGLEDDAFLEEKLSEQLLDRLVDGDITFSFIFNLGMCLNQAEEYGLEVRVFKKVIDKNKFEQTEREVLQLMVVLTTSLIKKEHFECTTEEFDKVLNQVKWEYLEWMGKTMKKMDRYDLVCRIVDKLWSKPLNNIAFWHTQLVTELKRFGDQLLATGKKLEALRVYQETFIKLARVDKEIGNEKYKYPTLKGMSPEAIKTVLERDFFVL